MGGRAGGQGACRAPLSVQASRSAEPPPPPRARRLIPQVTLMNETILASGMLICSNKVNLKLLRCNG
ncbi:unnamed protein product [Lampetra fluviatilis]